MSVLHLRGTGISRHSAAGRPLASPICSSSGLCKTRCYAQPDAGSIHRQGLGLLRPAQHGSTTYVQTNPRRKVIACVATQLPGRQLCAVRPVSDNELAQVARLRAEAYYADDRSRYVETFKRKFAAQEVESLRARTAGQGQGAPICQCLVAVSGSSTVIGCIDIRVPEALSGTHPAGVPSEDPHGCYILNVVVDEDLRGQGVGKQLMRAAMASAIRQWQAQRLYTHVEADNEVAYRLYLGCGFQEHSAQARYEAASSLGRLLLLQADACDVEGELE